MPLDGEAMQVRVDNMGWIVSSEKTTGDLTKEYSDTVKNANEVKFIGKNGIQVSGKTDAEGVRTLTFEMEAGEVTPTEITKADGTKLVKVGNKVYKPEDIGTDGQPKQGKDPVGTIANDGKVYNNGDVTNGAPNNGANPIDGITVTPNNGSKFVTGNQVADAIEKSGFVVGKNNKALSASDFKNEDEKVNPNDELRFADGDNTNVKLATKEELDASGKVKTVTTVKVDVVDLPVKYTDADGNIVKKGEDGKYYNPKDLEGKVYDPTTKTYKNADGTALDKQPEAKNNIVSSLVNPNDAKDGKVGTPSTLTNIANGAKTFEPVAADGTKLVQVGDKFYPADKVENGVLKPDTTPADAKDPVKLANDGKWYLASQVEANGKPKENATPIADADLPNNIGKSGLVDFSNSNPNNAATVGDLQNLGFVVSTSDNGYSDQVRNANKVDFKGGNGIEVTGKTTLDGIREITVGIKEGTVTNNVKVTKEDGTVIEAIRDKDGKLYEKDVNGKVDKTKPVEITNKDKVENNGSGFVTGNTVATAIQESGWNVGIGSTDKDFSRDAKVYDKVNPNDDVKFANGANTNVSMVTVDALNEDGTKKATTYVKVDVNRDLKIDSVTTGGTATDKNGNNLVKEGDAYYKESDIDPVTKQPKADAKPVPKADVTPAKDGAMTVKDAKGNDGVSATAKDGKGTLTLKDAGKDGKDASQVDISTAKAPADLENTPKDAVRANDGNWYTPADVTVEVKDGKTVVTPKAGKTPIPNAPTMDRIQYTGTDGKPRNVATMDDGLRFVGDDGEAISKPLNSTMEFTGGNRENGKPVEKADTTRGNIGVFHDNGKLSVQLAKDLEKMNSANFESKTDKDGNPLTMVDGKYYKPSDLENGKPKEKATPVGSKDVIGSSSKITGNGLSVTPETAKVVDPKTGKTTVDPKKVVSFGGPTIMKDPKTGKPVIDSKTGEPVMESGISAGGQVMTNVAPGRISPTSTDAINGSQLHAVASNLNNKINKVGKRADAGTASALAAATIPQAYTPGKSLVGIAAGNYQGQNGLAVGMSRISDNGKIIIRLSGTANSQGKTGVAAGVGYQW